MTDLLSAILRAASFVALLQALGGTLFLALFGARLAASRPRILAGVRITLGVAGILVVAQYALEAARLAGELPGVWDADLQRLAWRSAAGTALRLRLAGLVLVAWGLRGGRAGVICLAGVLLAVLAFAAIGHTTDHAHRSVLALLLVCHLLSVAFWFGALWPLQAVTRLEERSVAAAIVERFSRLAIWIVPGLLLAGASLALALLPGIAALAQPYGLLLLAKIGGYALLMGLAGLNKLALSPALSRGDAGAARRLRNSLTAEYLLIAAVLAVTAAMTMFYSPEPS